MKRFRFGFGWCVGVVLVTGCGRAGLMAKSAESAPSGVGAMSEAVMTADAAPAPAPASASSPESGGVVDRGAPPPAPPEPGTQGTPGAAEREMLDIEAHLALLVANLNDALRALRKQAAARGGTITSDVVQDEGGSRQATVAIRVPAGESSGFLDDVDRLGEVTSRQITAKDIGREYHDSQIVLHNLERTLSRYEEILQKAQSVEEILKIEAELSRLRGEIDRVKGSLRYLGDRAARSTVYVVIHERSKEIAQSNPEVAKFFPGIRAVSLTQLRGERSTVSAFGGGIVVGAGRSLNIEVDALRRSGSTSNGLDAVLVTVGGDVYSDFLGGGNRRFLNPYLGVRVGYARITGVNDLAAGATLGVELWKSEYATVDTDLRVLGLFGKSGSEIGLQPTIGANVAF